MTDPDLRSDGLWIIKITSLVVWTCKFEKVISKTYSNTVLTFLFIQ